MKRTQFGRYRIDVRLFERKGPNRMPAVTVCARHMYTLAKPTGRHTPGLAPGKAFGQPACAKYVYDIIISNKMKSYF